MPQLSTTVCPTQSLLRALVGTIEDSKAGATHLRETESFLDSIEAHLNWYDSVLALVDGDEELAPGAIEEVSKAIYAVVEPIKQLCEGTTDRIPFELAVLLERELRDATGSEVCVALCPLPNLNFIYADVGSDIRDLFEGLAQWLDREVVRELSGGDTDSQTITPLGAPPRLPASHILLAFQYAMADDILFNSVLFHELGHHIFRSKFWETFSERYEKDLTESLDSEFPDLMASSGPKAFILAKSVDACAHWTSEVFSDAFASPQPSERFAVNA